MSRHTLESIEELSEKALLSMDQTVRQSASTELRYLSSYDEWDNVQRLFRETRNVYALFILTKAISFIVSNEIGPQERGEVQEMMLVYLRDHHAILPRFAMNGLFSVYAAALYLNWRLMLIGSGKDADDDDDEDDENENNNNGGALDPQQNAQKQEEKSNKKLPIGLEIEQKLTEMLPTEMVLRCMVEVLNHFAKEDSKTSMMAVRTSFATSVLPYFFTFGVQCMTQQQMSDSLSAVELCEVALDYVPPTYLRPLVAIRLTTQETIYVHPFKVWFPAMQRCCQLCEAVMLDPEADFTSGGSLGEHALRVLKLMSCTSFSESRHDPNKRTEIEAFTMGMINVGEKIIVRYRVTRNPELLAAGTSILVNVFERYDGIVGEYIFQNPIFVEEMAKVAESSAARWEEEDKDARTSLMTLFYLIAEKALRPLMSTDEALRTGDDLRNAQLQGFVYGVFESYFKSCLSNAHLPEDSYELRCAEGFVLNTEEYLQPLALMLFCENMNFSDLVERALEEAVEQYGTCVNLRGGAVVQEESIYQLISMCSENLASFGGAVVPGGGGGGSKAMTPMDASNEELALSMLHVVLSRISMIISLIGLALRARTLRRALIEEVMSDLALLKKVIHFCTTFLQSGDDITDQLLECMSLADECKQKAPEKKLHLGVLRAMFFFCSCALNTTFANQKSLIYIVIELICFTLSKHSDCIPLADDANTLITKIVEEGSGQAQLFSSERFITLIEKHIAGEVTLLSPTFIATSEEVVNCRTSLVKNLMVLLEQRHLIGLDTQDVVMRFILATTQGLKDDPLPTLRDFSFIVEGLENGITLKIMIQWACSAQSQLLELVMDKTCCNGVLKVLSALCGSAFSHLEMDNVEVLLWNFASFTMKAVKCYLDAALSRPVMDDVDEKPLFDVSVILHSICAGNWVNVGIMMFYEGSNFADVLLGAVDLLMRVDVTAVMAHTSQREKVFRAILTIVYFNFPSQYLQAAERAMRVWPRLASYLTRCLNSKFMDDIVRSLIVIVQNHHKDLWGIIIMQIFREAAVALSTLSFTEESITELCTLIESCFHIAPDVCENVLEELLNFASAYHRVRLRSLLMMLRSPPPNIAKSFVGIFGVSSKVATLSAW